MDPPASPSSGRATSTMDERHQSQSIPHDYELTHAYVIRAPLVDLKGHTGAVAAADWLSSGAEVASASWDSTVRVWSAETGVQVHCERKRTSVQDLLYFPLH
jgi:WD40 repeat protein